MVSYVSLYGIDDASVHVCMTLHASWPNQTAQTREEIQDQRHEMVQTAADLNNCSSLHQHLVTDTL